MTLLKSSHTANVFHGEIDLALGVSLSLNNVGVTHTVQYRDLVLDARQQTTFEDLLLVNYLDGNAFASLMFHA